MATQGTTVDLMTLVKSVQDTGMPLAPKGKILFIFDPPGTYNRAIGLILNSPYTGPEPTAHMDANL